MNKKRKKNENLIDDDLEKSLPDSEADNDYDVETDSLKQCVLDSSETNSKFKKKIDPGRLLSIK